MRIRYRDGMEFEAESRGISLTIDQPRAGGGNDHGMTPPELLMASLGSCVGVYLVDYCRRAGLPVDGLEMEVTAERAKDPGRFSSLQVTVKLPGSLPEARIKALQRVAESCMVHNTLSSRPDISIEVAVHNQPA